MPSEQDAVMNNEGAVNEGGHEPTDQEIKGDGRLDFMDQIAEQVEQERDPGAAEVVNDQIDAAGVDQPATIDDPSKYKVKVKLEGKEEELSLDEVLRGFQKDQVASRRLNEATRLLKEAEEKVKAAGSAAPASESSAEPAEDVRSEARKVIDALMEGDDGAAAEALAALAAGRGNSTQTQSLASTDEVAAAVKHQLEVESALSDFEKQYSDVVTDPHLATMTNAFLQEELLSETDMAVALRKAGDRTRDWLSSKTGGGKPQGDSSTASGDRVAMKRGMDSVPNLSASSSQQGEADESAHDIINAMKAERGLIA